MPRAGESLNLTHLRQAEEVVGFVNTVPESLNRSSLIKTVNAY